MAAPRRSSIPELAPYAARGEAVAAAVERVGMLERQWVVAIELRLAREGEAGDTEASSGTER